MRTISELVAKLNDPATALEEGRKIYQKLERQKDEGVHDALVELACGPHVYGSYAVDTLQKRAKKGDARALAAIAELAMKGHEGVRHTCAHALGRFKDEIAFAALTELCQPGSPVRLSAAQALHERLHGDKAVRADKRAADAFLRLVGDETCRVVAAHGLALTRDERAVEALIPYLEDPDMKVRLAALLAVEDIGHPSALPALEAYRERATEQQRIGIDRAIKTLAKRRR